MENEEEKKQIELEEYWAKVFIILEDCTFDENGNDLKPNNFKYNVEDIKDLDEVQKKEFKFLFHLMKYQNNSLDEINNEINKKYLPHVLEIPNG